MVVSYLFSIVLYQNIHRSFVLLPYLFVLFALLEFTDDWIKIKKVRDGVSVKEKLVGLFIISCVIAFWVCLLVLSSNSMNLTDGLDGLALGISSIVFIGIMVLAEKLNNQEVFFYAAILFAICLGTLVFNHYPAKVFMGDTGSLFLGGTIAALLIRLGLAIWIPIVLAVCMWEVLSVIIQLTSIRFRKKKVFLIAPYHHHLEKKNISEVRICIYLWGISLLCTIIGVIGYLWIIQH